MIELLKQIGWTELYPQTLERLQWFRNRLRDYYSEEEVPEEELVIAVVYGFGKYGQSMVFNIYRMTRMCCNGSDFLTTFERFTEAFKETVPDTYAKMKPSLFIDLFIEYMYSRVIKGEYPE